MNVRLNGWLTGQMNLWPVEWLVAIYLQWAPQSSILLWTVVLAGLYKQKRSYNKILLEGRLSQVSERKSGDRCWSKHTPPTAFTTFVLPSIKTLGKVVRHNGDGWNAHVGSPSVCLTAHNRLLICHPLVSLEPATMI